MQAAPVSTGGKGSAGPSPFQKGQALWWQAPCSLPDKTSLTSGLQRCRSEPGRGLWHTVYRGRNTGPLSLPHQGVCLMPLLTDQSCTLNCHQGWAGCQRELWFKQPVLHGRKDQPGHSCPRTQYISLWAEQGWRRESLCPGCLHAEQRGRHTAPGKQDGGVIKPHCLLISFHCLN